MALLQKIVLLSILYSIGNGLYLYHTEDVESAEFYDCFYVNDLKYCRRPTEPHILKRNERNKQQCYHDGKLHAFTSLHENNIAVSTILDDWNSSVEAVEQYSIYKQQNKSDVVIYNSSSHLCECVDPSSFGKNCEYLLPMGTTMEQTLAWEIQIKQSSPNLTQTFSDITCYRTLDCDSGILCLDWRDICDGLQHCSFGYDEENCDFLEFNECEDDEYRCRNGMCIPEEYFLDGIYDCLDWSDEQIFFNFVGGRDENCANEAASIDCDDLMCPPDRWSCGDGQCVLKMHNYLIAHNIMLHECKNFRDRYHICELAGYWTLPNGKCSKSRPYEGLTVEKNDTMARCIYLLRCALTAGAEINCSCNSTKSCVMNLRESCPHEVLQYPNGGVRVSYIMFMYNISLIDLGWRKAVYIELRNASVKCRGYMVTVTSKRDFNASFTSFRHLEQSLCQDVDGSQVFQNYGYDLHCHKNSRTFNNRSYHFVDVCNDSKECISAYRIIDGYHDCLDKKDENRYDIVLQTCSNVQHHRFRCSLDQPTCFVSNTISDGVKDCHNNYDESWMGASTVLGRRRCKPQAPENCDFIRQYIRERLVNVSVFSQTGPTSIPFRFYCNTFWDLPTKNDENSKMCQAWWRCPKTQWQCQTGQCIEIAWLLDFEWDCTDASDEQGLLSANNLLSPHNSKLANPLRLGQRFDQLYSIQSFWKICNLRVEYPCFRKDVSDPLNITQNRPCISVKRIGDGKIDCVGAMDERNTINLLNPFRMLGNNFMCPSNDKHVSYARRCITECSDDRVQCFNYDRTTEKLALDDVICLDGRKIENGWCNQRAECFHGEDEYLCGRGRQMFLGPIDKSHREQKAPSQFVEMNSIALPQIPLNTFQDKREKVITTGSLTDPQNVQKLNRWPISIAVECNRGIGLLLYNNSVVCFCPPQYYGDKCQFHSDRITLLFHFKPSKSSYTTLKGSSTFFTLLIIFLFEDQPLLTDSLQIVLTSNTNLLTKRIHHLLYSRSKYFLEHKRTRYFNRSNIILEHPYSVRFEGYELHKNRIPKLVKVWQYPIHFDFLPSFRLAKVLKFEKPENTRNPCSSNPCHKFQECHELLNENSSYVCLCPPGRKGEHCHIIDEVCKMGFCSSNGLCKPNYRGLLLGNSQPYCICSLGEMGNACKVKIHACDSNPCENSGTCIPSALTNTIICRCTEQYYGNRCELKRRSVDFVVQAVEHQVALVQYLTVKFSTLGLTLAQQHLYEKLPYHLEYFFNEPIAPEVILAKLWSHSQYNIHLISFHLNASSIKGKIYINETNLCPHVRTFFRADQEISLFKYHSICWNHEKLLCFFDGIYVCICEENHERVECFLYEHSLDQCSHCLADGYCIKEDESAYIFKCMCSQCRHGPRCEFSNREFTSTLSSLISRDSHAVQAAYLSVIAVAFLIGSFTNVASFVTFRRPNPRKMGIGIYLFLLAPINQCSLLALLLEMVNIYFSSMLNTLSCKIISHVLSLTTRCSFWLISWITFQRVYLVIFPFDTFFKNYRVAIVTSSITFVIIMVMHIHELLFYTILTDFDGKKVCIINLPKNFYSYNQMNVLFHYVVPFVVQIISITILIMSIARVRNRTNGDRATFLQTFKEVFHTQKELYITPAVIILGVLPHMIISALLSCSEIKEWQRHLLCVVYLLSYAPQLLGFLLFVLPSTAYTNEFRETKLFKRFFVRFTIKDNRSKSTVTNPGKSTNVIVN